MGRRRELWRPVPGAPKYEVSDLGRIRSWLSFSPVVLSGYMSGNGYRYVELTLPNGDRRRRSLHSLVCETFHGPRPDGQEVRHLDGDPLNCAAANLRWGTPSENRHDSVRHGTHRMVQARG